MKLIIRPLVILLITFIFTSCATEMEHLQPVEVAAKKSNPAITTATTTTVIQDCIDFNELATGATPGTISTLICNVPIYGSLPSVPGEDRAMIFDAENWSGNDDDLEFPGQGKILILSGDGDETDPDDANEKGAMLSFDFSACGPVTVISMTVMDVEQAQGETKDAKIITYDGSDAILSEVPIPNIGNNLKMTLPVNQAGVARMEVILDGSGAIDDICFSKEVPGGGGDCTYTIGYWKTHSDDGKGNQADEVGPLLPIWLGTPGGTESVEVTTSAQASGLLDQKNCGPGNGIGKLRSQLLGAKLNIANGADGSDVNATIASADAFLANHGCSDWASLSNAEQATVLGWHGMLDNYNNGNIGPGHCD